MAKQSPDDRSVRLVSDAIQEQRADPTLRDRIDRAWTRLLVDVNRWYVVAGLAAAVSAATVLVAALGPVSQTTFMFEGVLTAEAFIELQTGIVTVMTIVLTINQLVLAPDLGPVGRQRLDDGMSHRVEIESITGLDTAPTEPAHVLAALADAVGDRADRLQAAVADADDTDLDRAATDAAEEVAAAAATIHDALTETEFERVEMLGAALHYDTARDIHRLRRVENEHEAALSAAQRKALDDLIDALEAFAVSREYFRTLYIRSEFVGFTRAVLYTGLPALLVAHYTVQIVTPEAFPGATLGVQHNLWFVATALTVSTVPILVLISYVARLATLSKAGIFVSAFTPGRENHDEFPGTDRQ